MIDWKIAAIIAMIALGVYNFLIRKFFVDGQDWRILIPMIFLGVLATAVYYAAVYKEVKFTNNSLSYLAGIGFFGLLVVIFSLLAVSHPKAELSVIIPVFALSTVITILLATVFLHEQLTTTRIIGVILALASIYLIAAT